MADDENEFACHAADTAPEFPQELIDRVLEHMRSMTDANMFCAVIEVAARHGLAKTLPNMAACKALAEYQGKAPFLLMMGRLLEPDGKTMIAEIPKDDYAHVCAAVDAAHSVLEKKGETHTVWLTVSRGANLIEYFQRIMENVTNPDEPERVLH